MTQSPTVLASIAPVRLAPPARASFPRFHAVQTRWMDNDAYGHINNVTYYSYFDTVVNHYLIGPCGLDIHRSPTIALMAETGCQFRASFAYPDDIEAGLRVGALGTSSVRWELGLFAPGEDAARVNGFMVHVLVDRATQCPVPIPAPMRAAMEKLLVRP
jgi:acyl-CoA thioester hydrolase